MSCHLLRPGPPEHGDSRRPGVRQPDHEQQGGRQGGPGLQDGRRHVPQVSGLKKIFFCDVYIRTSY